ncbi:RNA polymerase sigma factor [Williamsia sp. MIQD14]|uniref:RNA polymerase sigma factor n=1 Tax=Williamsia sp. MIQD14 TaxID=3425703 RepID=UPI003DA057A7
MTESGAAEAELLLRARGGDQQAFGELMSLHRNRVWAVCLNVTGNNHDAEDAFQETLISTWQHLDRFRGEAKFTTWLHRVTANCALAVVRRRKPRTDTVDFTDTDQPVVLTDDTASRFDDHVAERDQLRSALAELPEDFRTAIVLREFGDLSYADIAEHTGVGVQTVKSRLNRARSHLATTLRGYDLVAD